MKNLRVFHPFLFAIFPILFLFSHNIAESPIVLQISLLRLGVPIIITLCVTLVLWKLTKVLLKESRKPEYSFQRYQCFFITDTHIIMSLLM